MLGLQMCCTTSGGWVGHGCGRCSAQRTGISAVRGAASTPHDTTSPRRGHRTTDTTGGVRAPAQICSSSHHRRRPRTSQHASVHPHPPVRLCRWRCRWCVHRPGDGDKTPPPPSAPAARRGSMRSWRNSEACGRSALARRTQLIGRSLNIPLPAKVP